MVRAKFNCQSVKDYGPNGGKEYEFHAVTSGSEENKAFFKYTPGGHIKLHCVNENVKFEPGKNYYIDFSEAE